MSKLERTFQSDAFDAIGIVAIDGEFKVEGIDGDQVEIAAEFDRRPSRDLVLEPADRWLQLQLWERYGDAQFTLRLPKKKAWVVDISAAQGEVEIKGVMARLRVMIGKGEIRIKDSRGVFNLASGKGEIEMQDCVEAEVPERPAMPQPQFQGARANQPPMPEPPPMPGGPGMAGEFHAHFGPGPRMHARNKPDVWWWDWFGFDSDDWAEWGTQFGEQARTWAEQFAGHFVGGIDWLPVKAGVSARIGKGDAKLQAIEAKTCAVKLANGDLQLKSGRIEGLDVSVGRGEIECDSVLPAGEWAIDIKNGPIRLALPSNTQARLDVATRHGDIDSQVPLVRVGRPGPESRYGGRMVGTIGQADDNNAKVSLTALHGDIDIRMTQDKSKYAAKQSPSPQPTPAQAAESNSASVAPAQATAASESTAKAQPEKASAAIDADKSSQAIPLGPGDKPIAQKPAPVYESQLAILQALSEGRITVEEAEKLLRSMDWQTDQPKNVWGSVKNLFHKA